MKAPDKIYLYREQPKDYFDEDWHELPASDVENTEYIRKDALLEWINEMKEKHRGFTDTELVVTLDKLTEKINSF